MHNIYIYIFAGVAAYLVGSIPFALIIGHIKGVDIRSFGSGNPGATNVSRAIGKRWGIACFTLDFLKGFFPVMITKLLVRASMLDVSPDIAIMVPAVTVVCGHVFPLYIGFRGGKGIATSAGALIAVSPIAVTVSLLVWCVFFQAFHYVSLASILAATALPIAAYTLSRLDIRKSSPLILVFLAAISILTIIRHKSNINRLMKGTEHRFPKGDKTGSGLEGVKNQ